MFLPQTLADPSFRPRGELPVPGPCAPDIRFGDFRLLSRERRLEHRGVAVALGGRAMDILSELVRRAGEVVSKAELSQAAWPGMVVEEGNLRFHVASLRRVLNADAAHEGPLKTIPGRGYCFTAAVEGSATAASSDSAVGGRPPLPPPSRRLCGIEQPAHTAATALLAGRFLTLVGAPGIGKTTLALEVGRRLQQRFAHGVVFVDMGGVAEPQGVAAAVAAGLGCMRDGQAGAEDVLTTLEGQDMLLILDGCEHLIDAVADLSALLMRHLPELAILATSRESLRLEGEQVYRMAPLACPPAGATVTAEEALAFPAVDLFVGRMQAGRVGFDLRDEDADMVAAICRQLDGIPLALELAAGRAAICGLNQIAALLDSPMRLLWRGWRTAAPRHQTLKATLDWSYDLLTPVEQHVFRHLGQLGGGFTLSAAQSAAGHGLCRRDDVEQIVLDLVARSLVVAEVRDGEPHYRLLDMTRDYARGRMRDELEIAVVE